MFLLQILRIIVLFLSRSSGVQLYFIISVPIAFVLFETRDRTLQLAPAWELEPSLDRAIVQANGRADLARHSPIGAMHLTRC